MAKHYCENRVSMTTVIILKFFGMNYHHFNNQDAKLTLACPLTARLIYDKGRFLKYENIDYGIPLILLPTNLIARVLQNADQWRFWQDNGRLTFDPAPDGDPALFRTVSLSPCRYEDGWYDDSLEKRSVTRDEIIADPLAFAQAHHHLAAESKLFTQEEKKQFLNAARITMNAADVPSDLPITAGVNLAGNIIDVFARRGYDKPTYHRGDDDEVYFNYLREVPDHSLAQAMAYLETLSDRYLVYGVACAGRNGGVGGTNLHLFEKPASEKKIIA